MVFQEYGRAFPWLTARKRECRLRNRCPYRAGSRRASLCVRARLVTGRIRGSYPWHAQRPCARGGYTHVADGSRSPRRAQTRGELETSASLCSVLVHVLFVTHDLDDRCTSLRVVVLTCPTEYWRIRYRRRAIILPRGRCRALRLRATSTVVQGPSRATSRVILLV